MTKDEQNLLAELQAVVGKRVNLYFKDGSGQPFGCRVDEVMQSLDTNPKRAGRWVAIVDSGKQCSFDIFAKIERVEVRKPRTIIIDFRMEVPEEPDAANVIDPVGTLTRLVAEPLRRLVEEYKLGKIEIDENLDNLNLGQGERPSIVCAFSIWSHHHHLDSVTCYFEKGGSGRFIRLKPSGATNVLEGSWIFMVYMIIPFLQELATRQKRVNSQIATLERVRTILEEGQRKIL